jgi:hypothetical protein
MDDINDLKSTTAYKTLLNLYNDNTITYEEYFLFNPAMRDTTSN